MLMVIPWETPGASEEKALDTTPGGSCDIPEKLLEAAQKLLGTSRDTDMCVFPGKFIFKKIPKTG